MRIRIVVVLCSVLLLILPVQAQDPSGASVTPSTISEQLCDVRCVNETVSVGVPPFALDTLERLDVVFVLDVSMSMDNVLDQAQAGAITIGESVQANIEDTRFAVVNFADYDASPPLPWELKQDFSNSLQALQATMDSLELTGGVTASESYGRALWEAGQLAWRDDAIKLIVLFTDDAPHDPDAGIDGEVGTGDDLSFEATLESLALRNIRVIAINSSSSSISELDLAADKTGGRALQLDDSSSLASGVISMITTEIEDERARYDVRLSSADTLMTGLTISPASYPYPEEGGTLEFTAEFCPSSYTSPAENYQFDLIASNDFVELGKTGLNVDYSPICSDIVIADHSSDDGSRCSDVGDAVFWESPDIIVRQLDDDGPTSQSPIIGEENYIYVRVRNIGIEAVDEATLTVYESSSLIAPDFPGLWQSIGTIDFSIGANEGMMLGPLAWTPTTDFVSLRSHVDSDADPIELLNDVACENSIAQLSQTTITLTSYSSEPGTVSATIPMVLTNPPTMGHDNLDLSLVTNDASGKSYVRYSIEPTYFETWLENPEVVGGAVTDDGVVSDYGVNNMVLPDFIPQFDDSISGELTIASSDTRAFNKVEAQLIARDRVVAGASIYVVPNNLVVQSDAPVDSRLRLSQIVPIGLGALLLLSFAIFSNRS